MLTQDHSYGSRIELFSVLSLKEHNLCIGLVQKLTVNVSVNITKKNKHRPFLKPFQQVCHRIFHSLTLEVELAMLIDNLILIIISRIH